MIYSLPDFAAWCAVFRGALGHFVLAGAAGWEMGRRVVLASGRAAGGSAPPRAARRTPRRDAAASHDRLLWSTAFKIFRLRTMKRHSW